MAKQEYFKEVLNSLRGMRWTQEQAEELKYFVDLGTVPTSSDGAVQVSTWVASGLEDSTMLKSWLNAKRSKLN